MRKCIVSLGEKGKNNIMTEEKEKEKEKEKYSIKEIKILKDMTKKVNFFFFFTLKNTCLNMFIQGCLGRSVS